jgi:Leucine-rich repeat (LRR) protein
MNNLKVLSLSNNNIQGIPPAIGKMTTLEILDLTGNHVVSPSEYMVSVLCPGHDEQSTLDQISGSISTERNVLLNKHRTRRVKAALRIIENSSISITDGESHVPYHLNGILLAQPKPLLASYQMMLSEK